MKALKTITIALPNDVGRGVLAAAKENHRTVSEWIRDAVQKDRAKKLFHKLAAQSQKYAKRKGLTPKDFGGPFAE